jgi:hypothetical protein
MQKLTYRSTPKAPTVTQDQGCAFACHASQWGENPTFFEVAQKHDIRLRIDSMRDAVQSVLTAAQQEEGSAPLYRFAIHSFRDELTTLSALTADLKQASMDSNAIQLPMPILTPQGKFQGETYYDLVFPALQSLIGASGDGTKGNPKKLLFIVTDGVQDEGLFPHVSQPISPSLCSALTSAPNNVQIAVIYTTYLSIPNNPDYLRDVKPIQSEIAPNLQACASPGLYYEASDGPAIQTGMLQLFAVASRIAHLTN